MSYDFLTLPQPCDHIIAAERLAIGLDNRMLYSVDIPTQRMTGPINGLRTVVLSFNGVPIPQTHPIFGWEILPDEYSVPVGFRSKIRFKSQVLLRNFIIQVSYTTQAGYCHKCGGTSAVVDFKSNPSTGSFLYALGQVKLTQRLLKFILTSKCAFYPGLTCALRTFVGKKFGFTLTSDNISNVVSSAVDNLMLVQSLQAQYQTMDNAEIVQGLSGVTTSQDAVDPRLLQIQVNLTSPAGGTTNVNVGLRMSI